MKHDIRRLNLAGMTIGRRSWHGTALLRDVTVQRTLETVSCDHRHRDRYAAQACAETLRLPSEKRSSTRQRVD